MFQFIFIFISARSSRIVLQKKTGKIQALPYNSLFTKDDITDEHLKVFNSLDIDLI